MVPLNYLLIVDTMPLNYLLLSDISDVGMSMVLLFSGYND